MTRDELANKLEAVGKRVPTDIFRFSDGTNATEWNTAFHFAVQLKSAFPEYDCDFDISKVHEASGYRRPDIVLHKRGTSMNFLVIEMKMNGSPKSRAADEEKIRKIWFSNYHYEFGATITLNESICAVSIETNPEKSVEGGNW